MVYYLLKIVSDAYPSNKTTKSKYFEEIRQVVFDGISDNMFSLVQSGNYGVFNTTDS